MDPSHSSTRKVYETWRRKSAFTSSHLKARNSVDSMVLPVQVQSFTVRSEHHDRFHGSVYHAEPVRGPCRKLHGFNGFDGKIALAQDESQPARQHVRPLLPPTHG